MDVVYRRGRATAVEIHEDIPDPPCAAAVRTLLRILEDKGHLKHRQEGLAYVYRPSRPRQQAARSAFQRVLDIFFDGSLEKAVAAHLGEATELSADELKRLAELIRAARQREKES
jgi:BlaI family penicillinase repressor